MSEKHIDLQKRIDAAKAAGWTCDQVSTAGYWIASDPESTYSGFDKGEWSAWADILLDAELWPEIAALIGLEV